MKYFLVLFGFLILVGFTGIVFAEHDPDQPQIHSIILPSDMKEKTFEEFMEWCVPFYGNKCVKLEKNRVPIILSPLKQFKSGIPINEIQCRESLILVTKHGNSPACVKSETKTKLIERGWANKNNNSNKATFDDYIINCNNQTNPYQEYECFKDAYSNCHIATVNPEIYTIEGDPIYTTLTITPDCKVQGIADMSTDMFWRTPEIITTQCDKISKDEYTWSMINCDAHNLSEMQFNFQMQLYPQILECEENGDTWIREKFECVRELENEN